MPRRSRNGSSRKKWSIHLIRELFRGKTKFSQFLSGINGISTKVLAQRLRQLEDNGILTKVITEKDPLSINYYLTDKGLALQNLILELSFFAIRQYPDQVFASSVHQFELAEQEAKARFTNLLFTMTLFSTSLY